MHNLILLSVNKQSAGLYSIAPVTQLRKEDMRLSTLDCANAKGQCKINKDTSSVLLVKTTEQKAV